MSSKEKFYDKTLSQDAITCTWYRLLDIGDMFAEYVWMQLPLFDLWELGLGLLFSMLPVEFLPYTVDFEYVTPNLDELMQGIWANFVEVDYTMEYPWMTDWESYIKTIFKSEFWGKYLRKARYGEAQFYGYMYDPALQREFIAQVFQRIRLLRTADVSWKQVCETLAKEMDIDPMVVRSIVDRYNLMTSAQDESFCLGLSLLGRGKLNGTIEDGAEIPLIDYEGNIIDVKYHTLENIQFGFILGVTPLGYGILTPKKPMYSMKDGKENPEIIKITMKKTRGVINRLTLSTWAYSNYNKPEEMVNFHKSAKADQYGMLQMQRFKIEEWVADMLPESEKTNAVTIRQYKNAVMQAIAWKAKRHKWGFKPFELTTEEEYKEWWVSHWKNMGLNEEVLRKLYADMERWVEPYRNLKKDIGESIKKIRRMRAFSPYL